MRIEIKALNSYSSLELICLSKNSNKNTIFFYGNETLDNRSREITSFFKKQIQNNYKIIYNKEKFIFSVNYNKEEKHLGLVEFRNNFINNLSNKVFILDTTSLGFVEILLLLHFISEKIDKNIVIKLFYAEPEEYRLKDKRSLFKNEFDLSESFSSFKKIPIYSTLIDSSSPHKAKLISLLGFENDRLSRILEEDDGAIYDDFEHIIALPAFKPGWENISLHRHSHELAGFHNLEFAPANNPYETYRVLEKIQKNSKDKHLTIAPIGTKPHAIGAIIFLINSRSSNKKVEVIYDFPIKKENRTDGIGVIHEYRIGLVP